MRILNINNFFSKYILDPFSKELTFRERIAACVASAFLLLFLAIPHITSYFWNARNVSKINLKKKINANFASVKKVNDLFPRAVQRNGTPLKARVEPLSRKKLTCWSKNLSEISIVKSYPLRMKLKYHLMIPW